MKAYRHTYRKVDSAGAYHASSEAGLFWAYCWSSAVGEIHNSWWPAARPHFHEAFELCYVIEGNREVTTNGKEETAAAGEFVMTLPNQVHQHKRGEGSFAFAVILFSPDLVPYFANYMAGRQGESAVFTCGEEITEICHKNFICNEQLLWPATEDLWCEPSPFAALPPEEKTPRLLAAQAWLHLICSCYMQQMKYKPREESSEVKLRQLLQYVSENYRGNITLAGAAETLGYNKDYLSRIFRQHFGMHFRQFINQYRLDCARKLIAEDKMGIEKAALASGFGTARNFYIVCKRMTRKTPSQLG
jgi:AraC-like DNA-binding protein